MFVLVQQNNRTSLLGVSSVLIFFTVSSSNLMGVLRLVQACLYSNQPISPFFSLLFMQTHFESQKNSVLVLFFFSLQSELHHISFPYAGNCARSCSVFPSYSGVCYSFTFFAVPLNLASHSSAFKSPFVLLAKRLPYLGQWIYFPTQ